LLGYVGGDGFAERVVPLVIVNDLHGAMGADETKNTFVGTVLLCTGTEAEQPILSFSQW
jgi:hypothetical protein